MKVFLFKLLYMKQLLITFNVIFLLFGNIFFLNIHSTHDHDHHHEHVEQECLECLNIENNSNYIVESGSHDDLVLAKGVYKKLWDIQTGKTSLD